jgi:photosystem II stability/assembly factor-like uncharacterized protein
MPKPFLALLAALLSIRVFAADPSPAAHGLLLDATTVGNAVIAVGERGRILRSTDSGLSWELLQTPTEATLTGISFANAQCGWVVGHDGTILCTRDGGLSWSQQLTDQSLSFLDVYALDTRHVFAIGAFGTFYATDDGGTTWKPRQVLEQDTHLNRITPVKNGNCFIAGERGTLLQFSTATSTCTPTPSGYEGSFFGVLALGDDVLLAYGLRGRVFRSEGPEISWQPVTLERPTLILTAAKLKNGTIVLAGQARAFFISKDNGRTFRSWQPGITTGVAELIEAPDGTLLAFGEAGVTHLPKPE